MPIYNPPIKGSAYKFFVSLSPQTPTGGFQANPTLATGDVKVSSDNGATFGNITSLPSATAGDNTVVEVDLDATEMNADIVIVVFRDAAGAEWCDYKEVIHTTTQGFDTIKTDTAAILVDTDTTIPALIGTPTDFGSGTSTLAANLQDLADNGTATFDRSTDSLQALRDHIADGTNLTEAGGTGDHLTAIAVASIANNAITAAAIATDAIDADAIAADAVTEIQSGLSTHAAADVWSVATRVLTANTNLNDPTAAAIADAVWDEAQADHVAAGSFGIVASEVADILVDTAEIGAAGAGLTTLATASALATVDSNVDAIKTKTDSLTFSVSNQVDANIKSVANTTVTGSGTEADPWGP